MSNRHDEVSYPDGGMFSGGDRQRRRTRTQRDTREAKIHDALRSIGDIIRDLEATYPANSSGHAADCDNEACSFCAGPKRLPSGLLLSAARTARQVNPVNAPAFWRLSAQRLGFRPQPNYIAALTSKYWGARPRQLTVSFMESAPQDLRDRIIEHMNAWTRTGGISFAETRSAGQVRISRERGGYWSYLGTDILHIPRGEPTMNLEGFTMKTPESEYRRVVRHETGHTLGFPHEHMREDIIARIDPEKAYVFCEREFGWDRKTVDEQILTPLRESTLLSGSTESDQTSIMCYQLPGSVTYDGEPIVGGDDINETDYDFCGLIYPKASASRARATLDDLPHITEFADLRQTPSDGDATQRWPG